jgi:hypothetical protein
MQRSKRRLPATSAFQRAQGSAFPSIGKCWQFSQAMSSLLTSPPMGKAVRFLAGSWALAPETVAVAGGYGFDLGWWSLLKTWELALHVRGIHSHANQVTEKRCQLLPVAFRQWRLEKGVDIYTQVSSIAGPE